MCLLLSRLQWGAHTLDSSGDTPEEGEFLTVKASVKADEFSMITANGAWTGLQYNDDTAMINLSVTSSVIGNGMGVAVGSSGVPSYQKAYRRVDSLQNSVTFPVLMAVIRVEEGKVKEITWDDTCNWCDTNRCAPNTYNFAGESALADSKACFLPDSECVVAGTEVQRTIYRDNGDASVTQVQSQPECALKVYITWSGTDSKGFHFLSSATRFSRLDEAQVKHLIVPEE